MSLMGILGAGERNTLTCRYDYRWKIRVKLQKYLECFPILVWVEQARA